MLESFQRLIMADAVTARFLAIFIGCLLALYAVNAVYAVRVPRLGAHASGRKPGLSPIQAAAKSLAMRFAQWVASLAITPNQITLVGLALVAFSCLLFAFHRNTFIFGSSLMVAYLFDTLDGVVARAQGTSTRFGGYLDAVVDRYQEVVTFLVIGWVTDLWLVSFLAMTGSLLTSYNKARTALEIDIDNKGWPDLLEKPARLFILCVALIGNNTMPWMLPVTLWALAGMTHFTALQRIMRSYLLIQAGQNMRERPLRPSTMAKD